MDDNFEALQYLYPTIFGNILKVRVATTLSRAMCDRCGVLHFGRSSS